MKVSENKEFQEVYEIIKTLPYYEVIKPYFDYILTLSLEKANRIACECAYEMLSDELKEKYGKVTGENIAEVLENFDKEQVIQLLEMVYNQSKN